MTILILDDDSTLVDRMVGCLRREGHEVLTASRAIAALNLLGDSPAGLNVDLVLLDLLFADSLGLEICRHIKASPSTRDIPVIVMAGPDNENLIGQAFDLGATDYIEKPFTDVGLITRVRLAMRLKAEMEAKHRQSLELQNLMEQLRRTNEQLLHWSLVDTLTGLYNRRFFDIFVESEFAQARQMGKPIAVIMIDVDYFKSYNDHFGHQQGDTCLRQLGETFSQLVSKDFNMVARYGGEEFAVVLPETDVDRGVIIAETLRLAVAGLEITHPKSPHGCVTISQGVAACIPEEGGHVRQLIKDADHSLYQAKALGRNKIYWNVGG